MHALSFVEAAPASEAPAAAGLPASTTAPASGRGAGGATVGCGGAAVCDGSAGAAVGAAEVVAAALGEVPSSARSAVLQPTTASQRTRETAGTATRARRWIELMAGVSQ